MVISRIKESDFRQALIIYFNTFVYFALIKSKRDENTPIMKLRPFSLVSLT